MNETLETALERVTTAPQQRTVLDLLASSKPELDKLLPAGVSVERFERIVRTELRRTPLLAECDPWSFLGAVMHCAQLNLEPGPLQLVHLIPFKREVQVIVGYRGWVELAYRSGMVKDVSAELVYAGDLFKVSLGTSPKIVHERREEDVVIVAAYAVAHLKTGGTVFKVVYEEDWERARKASLLGSKNQGPWKDDRPAMIRKTALRRLEPWLPKTPDIGLALQYDEGPAERLDEMIAPTIGGTE